MGPETSDGKDESVVRVQMSFIRVSIRRLGAGESVDLRSTGISGNVLWQHVSRAAMDRQLHDFQHDWNRDADGG